MRSGYSPPVVLCLEKLESRAQKWQLPWQRPATEGATARALHSRRGEPLFAAVSLEPSQELVLGGAPVNPPPESLLCTCPGLEPCLTSVSTGRVQFSMHAELQRGCDFLSRKAHSFYLI